MGYPAFPDFSRLVNLLSAYGKLKHERGARNVHSLWRQAQTALQRTLRQLQRLPIDRDLARREPDDLTTIRRLRPAGPRRLWQRFEPASYRERLAGAFLGRCAGCTLGAPVEFWPIERMEQWAKEIGQKFPPQEYWWRVPEPYGKRYGVSRCDAYTKSRMDGVPVDDDLAYTLLGLLIMEDYGPDFTVAEVAKAWLKYLPYACTAEDVALKNLKKGIPPAKAGEKDNPYCEWIGADIRSDPWGYLAPAWPEKAAEFAYRDAFISHRRQGIYGAMYFAAVIAAAFAVDDPFEALRIGLTEIPRDSAMAETVRWALRIAPRIRNYRQARAAMDKRFAGMDGAHTLNNACLTIWGISIGRKDFSKVIAETVAMGMDNDCTAATAGSIVGAVVGRSCIPRQWTARFHDKIHSYLIKRPSFKISDILRRFENQAMRVWREI